MVKLKLLGLVGIGVAVYFFPTQSDKAIQVFLLVTTFLLLVQGIVTVVWVLYAWRDPNKNKQKPPKFVSPKYSFTAMVPVRFEDSVITDTLHAIHSINYPSNLCQTIVVCRHDDVRSQEKIRQVINQKAAENIILTTLIDSFPINKPNKLNHALKSATGNIVCVFDAEDEPHPEIYNWINSIFVKQNVDVVQAGVQLTNHTSTWFSAFSVLEYYFWFKSGLPFFTRFLQFTLLAGNTVFIKKEFLGRIGGWNENTLTEDADIAIRLMVERASIKAVYHPLYATKEETPETLYAFIRQRTRWFIGFLQILAGGDWRKLPSRRQQFAAFYLLLAPFIPMILLLLVPAQILVVYLTAIPIWVAIVTFLPTFILILLFLVQLFGIYNFARDFKKTVPLWLPVQMATGFIPYIILLSVSAVRAFLRFIGQNFSWEKTTHFNLHRART